MQLKEILTSNVGLIGLGIPDTRRWLLMSGPAAARRRPRDLLPSSFISFSCCAASSWSLSHTLSVWVNNQIGSGSLVNPIPLHCPGVWAKMIRGQAGHEIHIMYSFPTETTFERPAKPWQANKPYHSATLCSLQSRQHRIQQPKRANPVCEFHCCHGCTHHEQA